MSYQLRKVRNQQQKQETELICNQMNFKTASSNVSGLNNREKISIVYMFINSKMEGTYFMLTRDQDGGLLGKR